MRMGFVDSDRWMAWGLFKPLAYLHVGGILSTRYRCQICISHGVLDRGGFKTLDKAFLNTLIICLSLSLYVCSFSTCFG